MYSEIADNKRKTWVIMVLFVAFIGLLAYIFSKMYGQPSIAISGLIFGLSYSLISYFAGSRLSLAVNGAKEIQKSDNPVLWRIVENLAITEGVPMPRVFIMPDPAPNAFATGRNPQNSAVCVTQGLLDIMEKPELEGVLAHELGHVRNYDIRVSMIAFALSAAVSVLADFVLRMTWFRSSDDGDNSSNNTVFMILGIIAALVAPLIATMIQLAISRKREYLADATGALTTRYPEGLARALEKIGQVGSATQVQNTATAHLFFANPLRRGNLTNLFSTHPPIADRVERLRNMNTHA